MMLHNYILIVHVISYYFMPKYVLFPASPPSQSPSSLPQLGSAVVVAPVEGDSMDI